MMLNAPSTISASDNAVRRGLVMVVEDETIIREFVCEILQGEGFDTIEYGTADDAWKAFDEGVNINLLITDVRMPGHMNGFQLTHSVHTKWPALPIIVMSGHETFETFKTLETVKMSDDITFLPKPWTIGKLTDEVMKAIPAEEVNLAR
jgi:DNA-binding NtrC family response regulator